jgi:hypothetical protein
VKIYELAVEVTDEVGLGEPLHVAAKVCVPEDLTPNPVVCFGFPGGGYNANYFTFDMPDANGGGEAGWHTSRGWIFVACDHLACGDSTPVTDLTAITWEHLIAANAAATRRILALLAGGEIDGDLAPVVPSVTIGVGQSMGGAILILQQGRHHLFDAVGILGWSGNHAVSWLPPGTPRPVARYWARGTSMGDLTREMHTAVMPEMAQDERGLPATARGFHYDDVPDEIVMADLVDYPTRRGQLPEWATAVIPPSAMTMMSPGAVSAEAAMITEPVFIGVGERDVCPDPRSEPKAYQQADDVTLFVCPRMGHMHNFASTRELLWDRLHTWGDAVATLHGNQLDR